MVKHLRNKIYMYFKSQMSSIFKMSRHVFRWTSSEIHEFQHIFGGPSHVGFPWFHPVRPWIFSPADPSMDRGGRRWHQSCWGPWKTWNSPGSAAGTVVSSVSWMIWRKAKKLTGAFYVGNGWEWMGLLLIVIVDHSWKFPTKHKYKYIGRNNSERCAKSVEV